MLPVLTIHVKPGSLSFSARLQTTFALLIPRCGEVPPPDRLPRLPHPLSLRAACPRRCRSSSPSHTFQSGFGVSFTLNPALWLSAVSVERSLQLWCASAEPTLPFAASDVTPQCFFSCSGKAMCGSRVMPLKDMTGWRYDILVLGSDVFRANTCGTQKKSLPPLIPSWYVHKERLEVSQSSGTGIPNKIVCLCRLTVKTD